MQILTVNSEHIATGISKVLKARVPSNTLPILDNIHVKTIGGGIVLTYNNLESAITTGVAAEVTTEGKEFLLNPQAYTVLSMLKADDAQITFDLEDSVLNLTYNGNTLKFALDNVENFPAVETLKNNVPSFQADADTVAALTKCLPYTSKDDMRPAMTGIYFTNKEITATDAHRLIKIDNVIESKKDFSGIVRKQFVQALSVLGENVKIKISDSHISAHDNNTMIISSLIDAKFPDVKSVIPTDNNSSVSFFAEELKKNIKLATVLSAKSDRRLVIDMTEDSYTITGTDPDFDQEITLRGDCTAKNKDGYDRIRMGFNGAFLLQLFDSYTAEKVTFKLSKAEKAMIIKDDKTLFLIMPLLLTSDEEQKRDHIKKAA